MANQRDPAILQSTVTTLLEAARAASESAYAPYSGFPVGAALLTDDGSVISGANVENVSYGLTVCGERVAVTTAVAQGHRAITAIAISAPRSAFTTPCGACRQVLKEFAPSTGDVVVVLDGGPGSSPRLTTLAALLPDSFGPRNLD